MRAKINASMQKMDASLSLIADRFASGGYESEAELQAVLQSVMNAESNATKAYKALAKTASSGRAGITAIANKSFDESMTAVQQVSVKANLLTAAIKAELIDLEENKVTEDIESMDYDDEVTVEASDEITDEVTDEITDEVTVEATDEIDEVTDEITDEIDEVTVEATDEITDEGTDEIDDEGTVDLLDMNSEDDLFTEDESVMTDEVVPVVDKAALRASASRAGGKRPVGLESVWDFKP